jgi:hypothetical protein
MQFIKLKLYLQSACETAILIFLSIADIDAFARVTVSIIVVPLTLLTGYKVIQRIMTNKIQYKREKLELKMREEEVRRYFEQKYNDTKPSSLQISSSEGIDREQIQ